MSNTFLLVFVILFSIQWKISKTLQSESMEKEEGISVGHALSSIFEPGRAENILQEGLQNLHRTLNLIDKKFENITLNSDNYSAKLDFKSHIQNIAALADALNRHLLDPNEIKRHIFQEACRNYPMFDTIGWIHREITGSNHIEPLISNLEGIGNREEFLMWTNLVVLTVIKASILGDACLASVCANETKLYKTRESYRNDTLQGLNEIIDILKVKDELLENRIDWLGESKSYVFNYTRDNQNLTHQEFANKIHRYLSHKYFWRKWLVIIYDKDISAEPHFSDTQVNGFNVSDSYFNRSVVIVSPDYIDADVYAKKMDKCFSEYWLRPRECHFSCTCATFLNVIERCYNSSDYRGIFCVRHGSNLVMEGDPSWFKLYSIHLFQGDSGFTTKEMFSAYHEIRYDNYVFL